MRAGRRALELICDGTFLSRVVVRAGDGDDSVAVTGIGARLFGALGDDALAGGDRSDLLDGGRGADSVAGGTGWTSSTTQAAPDPCT